MILAIDIALLVLLAIIGIAVIRVRNLFAVAMLSGLYSFLMASLFVLLDAVDVAVTEAAVGAGISTVTAGQSPECRAAARDRYR